MSAVFERVRCPRCLQPHDVYVAGPLTRNRVYEFTCPATGERVPLSPRGKMHRHVENVPAGAVLASVSASSR